jgi:succinoglycan biosynthesis transport protein ExoP
MTLRRPDSPEAPTPIHLYLKVLRDRWSLITSVFVVTVVSAMVFTYLQPRVYQGVATVLIDPEAPTVVKIQEVFNDSNASGEYYGTQYQLLRSRPVIEPVIQRLNLKRRIGLPAGDPYPRMVGYLTIEPVKSSRLVLVRFDNSDPAIAMEVANAIAEQFVRYSIEVRQAEAQTAVTWLNEQIDSLRTKAQQSSKALQTYQAKADLLGLQEQRQITQAKLLDFNRAYQDAQNQRMASESKLRELSRIVKDPLGSETIFIVANDPLIQKLKTEASDLQIERSKVSQYTREKHPDLMQLDAQIREVKQRLQSEIQKMVGAIETESKVAKAREETLLANLNELRREARVLSEREAQAMMLQRDKDSVEELHASVLKRFKETGLASGLATTNIRVVEPAQTPTWPIRPKTNLIMAVASVFGLALGVGVAFVAESLDRRARSPEDIEQALGVPVLGVVPIFRARRHG